MGLFFFFLFVSLVQCVLLSFEDQFNVFQIALIRTQRNLSMHLHRWSIVLVESSDQIRSQSPLVSHALLLFVVVGRSSSGFVFSLRIFPNDRSSLGDQMAVEHDDRDDPRVHLLQLFDFVVVLDVSLADRLSMVFATLFVDVLGRFVVDDRSMFVVRLAERVERLLRSGTIGVAAAENRAFPLESADRMSTERDESRARPVGSDLSHRQSAVDRVEREREERRFQRLSERRRLGFARADANLSLRVLRSLRSM